MGYLNEAQQAGSVHIPQLAAQVEKQGGPGGWGQLMGILGLWLRFRGFRAEEFYTYALWRKDLPRSFLREFQTGDERRAFNEALQMPERGPPSEAIRDKVVTERLLSAAGLPVTRTLAAFGPATYADDIRHLRNAAEITEFLSDPAHFPLFGKPRFGTYAHGAAAMTACDPATGTLRFLTGEDVPAAGLAAEIVADWEKGYIFQPFYRMHPVLTAHLGAAMASVRICTLRTDDGVVPYYAVVRIPAKKAMHDGDAFGTRVWGLIDPGTGRIEKLSNLRNPMGPAITHWLNPDEPLLGLTMPDWQAAVAACLRAHDVFPGHGIIGWDVFLTEDGPLLNEANSNPGHVYQVAAARGLRNPDLEPMYQRALAHARRINAEDGVTRLPRL